MARILGLTILEFPGRDWNTIKGFVSIPWRKLTILEFPGRDWNEFHRIGCALIFSLTILEFPGRDWNNGWCLIYRLQLITYHFRIPWKGLKLKRRSGATRNPGLPYHFRIPWKGLKHLAAWIPQHIARTYHFRIPWKGLKRDRKRKINSI